MIASFGSITSSCEIFKSASSRLSAFIRMKRHPLAWKDSAASKSNIGMMLSSASFSDFCFCFHSIQRDRSPGIAAMMAGTISFIHDSIFVSIASVSTPAMVTQSFTFRKVKLLPIDRRGLMSPALRLSTSILNTLSLGNQCHVDHPRQHCADFLVTQHSASALLSPCAGNQFSTGEIANALKLWTKTRNDVYRQ